MPDLVGTFSFCLEVDSVQIASFRKCSGIESETEVVEFKETSRDGRMIIRKMPGAMKWSDITLEGKITSDRRLWEWRKQVIDGRIDQARRHGSIVIMDSNHKEVARWNFEHGWPSKYSGADFDAGANDVACEKLTICHEGLVRV